LGRGEGQRRGRDWGRQAEAAWRHQRETRERGEPEERGGRRRRGEEEERGGGSAAASEERYEEEKRRGTGAARVFTGRCSLLYDTVRKRTAEIHREEDPMVEKVESL
jgi:hypothetical protein